MDVRIINTNTLKTLKKGGGCALVLKQIKLTGSMGCLLVGSQR